MKYKNLGKNGPRVSALGLGCMGMSVFYGPTDETLSIEVIKKAYDEGITFFDTADMYGDGVNEELLGKAIRKFRDKIIISTKCGIELKNGMVKIHNSPEYIRNACDHSLQRLGTDRIDVYFLHRHNPEVSIEESMHAMQDLIKEGKISYVGLSEVDGKTIERAHKVLGDQLVALQSEYSILNHKDAEAVLPICQKCNLSFIAYSPLGRGLLSGKLTHSDTYMKSQTFDVRSISPQFQPKEFEHNLSLVRDLSIIAMKKKCTVAQLSLAWLMAQSEDIIPIPGTKKLAYLYENLDAVGLILSAQDLAAIDQVIRKNPIQGARLP